MKLSFYEFRKFGTWLFLLNFMASFRVFDVFSGWFRLVSQLSWLVSARSTFKYVQNDKMTITNTSLLTLLYTCMHIQDTTITR